MMFFYENLPTITRADWTGWDGSLDGTAQALSGATDIYATVKYDTDKVLIVYGTAISGLKAVVASMSGTSITYHTSVSILPGGGGSGNNTTAASASALDSSRVLVAYADTDGNLKAVVLSIDGSNTITKNTVKLLSATGATLSSFTLVKIASDQCVLTLLNTAFGQLSATCITVTGTTVDNAHNIIDNIINLSNNSCTITPLDSSSVFVITTVSDAEENISLNGAILTVASNTISVSGASVLIADAGAVGNFSCTALDSNRVVLGYDDVSTPTAHASIVTISDMSLGPIAQFGDTGLYNRDPGFGMVKIDNSTMMLNYNDNSANIVGCVLSVVGPTIIPGDPINITSLSSNFELRNTLVDTNRVFVGVGFTSLESIILSIT